MSPLQQDSQMVLESSKILCVLDEESENLGTYRLWAASQIQQFVKRGANVTLLHPCGSVEALPTEYRRVHADFIAESPIDEDSAKNRGRVLAQRAVKYGESAEFDIVIGFGWTVCRGIAGGKGLANKFWAVIDDFTTVSNRNDYSDKALVESLYSGSRKVFVFSEEKRSLLESTSPQANGRTYLPLLCRQIDSMNLPSVTVERSASLSVFLPGMIAPNQYLNHLESIAEAAKSPESRLLLHFDGSEELWSSLQRARETAVLAAIPGLRFARNYEHEAVFENALGLIPDSGVEPWIAEWLVADFVARGIAPISMSRFIQCYEQRDLKAVDPVVELTYLQFSESSIESINYKNSVRLLDAFGPPISVSATVRPTRVVLAGADFKFAGDLVELLNDSSAVDLRVDLWANNAHPNPKQSTPYRDWADVVICEFSSFNAIWYSQNKKPGQRLIVRLHGYELLQPWIDQLDFQQVDKVVFVSEFYRQKAIESRGWTESKTAVISNTIDFADLARPKLPGAEFHLGMAGLVPILKRPERALDLLEALIKEDDRFVLHLRGHSPWNYGWEWKKQAHQAAYRDFYARIGGNEVLRSHIAFESFGPDMAGWFRKIGWMLSPSYRETFHLAPVEGMASGTLPIVWDREGASDIFPKENIFSNTHEAAAYILETTQNNENIVKRSQSVQQFSAKYSRSAVNGAWIKLVLELAVDSTPILQSGLRPERDLELIISAHSHAGTAGTLLNAVREAWHLGEYSTAISLLDEGIKITANDTGELKQWENWVRGIYQTLMSLETIIPGRSNGYVYQPVVGRVARVVGTHIGESKYELFATNHEIEELVFGVELPSPAVGNDWSGDKETPDDLFARIIRFDGSLRMNYYVSQVASELASEFRNAGISMVVSTGGLVESLASLLAARRIGIPFVWHPSSEGGAKRFLSRFSEMLNDNPVHNIYQSILYNADAIIASGESDDVSVSMLTNIPVIHELSLSQVNELHASLEKEVSDGEPILRILYSGSGREISSLRTVGDVVITSPAELIENLEMVPDVLVFGFGESTDNVGANLTQAHELMTPQNLKLAQTAIVKARIMGVKTIFVSTTDPVTLGLGKELARKCDVIASNDRKSLVSYMRLNPNSNQVVVNISGTLAPPIVPKIGGEATPNVLVCYETEGEDSTLASALQTGQPFLAAWPVDERWNDTKRFRSNYEVAKYEHAPTPENKIRALWANCFELAQGRTGHDFAAYLMRSAGFEVTHHKSVPLGQVVSAYSAKDGPVTLGKIVVRTNRELSLDKELIRDIVSLNRISNIDSVDIISDEAGKQRLSAIDSKKSRFELERISIAEELAPLDRPTIGDFEARGISIVVATYMGAHRLPVLLDSVARQTLPKSMIQLVIIPNGPVDETVSVIESWAELNDPCDVMILPQDVAGVANARNVGIASATKEFITFVDDDDFLEPNFLLAMYARSADSTVVLGRLSDVDESTREVDRITATTKRVEELNERVLPLSQRAGALGMNGAKLLPTALLRQCVYDPSLRSGEDVAFMAQLLRADGVFVTSAADIDDSSYMRVLRSNSISRRDEDFQFMVNERLEVLKSLEETRSRSTSKSGQGAIEYLMTGQLGFIKRFVSGLATAVELERVLDAVKEYGLGDSAVLKPLIAQLNRGINRPDTLRIGNRVKIVRT